MWMNLRCRIFRVVTPMLIVQMRNSATFFHPFNTVKRFEFVLVLQSLNLHEIHARSIKITRTTHTIRIQHMMYFFISLYDVVLFTHTSHRHRARVVWNMCNFRINWHSSTLIQQRFFLSTLTFPIFTFVRLIMKNVLIAALRVICARSSLYIAAIREALRSLMSS